MGDGWLFATGPYPDSSGVYICNSIVNDLRHGKFMYVFTRANRDHLPFGPAEQL